ncbi:hypothetical protein Tco_1538650 [Tanacetum coccineum]
METSKPLLKDAKAEDVDVHLYRSMIGSLMYLTASRPDIMFLICACARFQVTPKVSHLHAVKRIFGYLKDRKSTTGDCQFLGRRLISCSYSAFDHDHDILVESRSWILQLVSEPRGSRSRITSDHSMEPTGFEIDMHFLRGSRSLLELISQKGEECMDRGEVIVFIYLSFRGSLSERFQEIVDFLNGSHLRCALTKNPTTYISLIEKFWQTATVRTVDNKNKK